MSHAAALTEQACGLFGGRGSAKGIARLVACSYRTIQDWQARRRAMCLDHAIELAARNDEFRAVLLARIEEVRGTNERTRHENRAARRDLAELAVGQVERRSGLDRRAGDQRRAPGSASDQTAHGAVGAASKINGTESGYA